MSDGDARLGPWFPVALHKFVVLSIFSFGIYDFYWVYQNWRRARIASGENFSPLWRTFFFVPVWVFSLLRRIRASAAGSNVTTGWNADVLGVAFMVLALVQLLPLVAVFLSLADCLPAASPGCIIDAVSGDARTRQLSLFASLASVLWCLPLVPPVRTIARLNAAATNPETVNDRYTIPCVVTILFGGFIYVILIVATLLGS